MSILSAFSTSLRLEKTENFLGINNPIPILEHNAGQNVHFKFFEIGTILRNIIYKGDIRVFRMLLHNSEIDVNLNKERNEFCDILDSLPRSYLYNSLISEITNVIENKIYDINIYNDIFSNIDFLLERDFYEREAHDIDDFLSLSNLMIEDLNILQAEKVSTISLDVKDELNKKLLNIRCEQL